MEELVLDEDGHGVPRMEDSGTDPIECQQGTQIGLTRSEPRFKGRSELSIEDTSAPRTGVQGLPKTKGSENFNDGGLIEICESRMTQKKKKRKKYYTTDSDSTSHGRRKYRRKSRGTERTSKRMDYTCSSDTSSERESTRMTSKTRSKKFRTKDTLGKFLSMLDIAKSSEKPKLPSGNNVLPEFDPLSKEQTVLVWLTKVEECAEIYGWSEKEIIHYALPKLTGVAKTWYQGLPSLLYSWGEWKKKLIESFPCRVDYAELLTEMLAKRAKYSEPLEHYYFEKLNLLNKCKIFGKHAVDCMLHGLDDRTIRVGAQAAQFNEPEQILKYFRSVKVGRGREVIDSNDKNRNERRGVGTKKQRTQYSKTGTLNPNIICFNCKQSGHPSFKCDKPLLKCEKCGRIGHQAYMCTKNMTTVNYSKTETHTKDKTEKQVSELCISNNVVDKYIFDIKIQGYPVCCHVDLGSQCSLIQLSKAQELGLNIMCDDNLPVLRGIGANLTRPVGTITAIVEVQGIKETIQMYVVDDYVINQPVLLGHSFTEMPDLVITKTPTKLIFEKINSSKVHLICNNSICIPKRSLSVICVKSNPFFSGSVYVNGSLRGEEGKEYYLLAGGYDIREGTGSLLIYNVSEGDITISKDVLITRSFKNISFDTSNVLDCCQVTFDSLNSDDLINCGETLSNDERSLLQNLLDKYRDCFSKNLKDLGFTNISEMVIELEDTAPIVYRPYRLSHSERALVSNMVQEMMDNGIVRESSSPYASPIVLVQKKTGEKRLCVDYRALNRKTKKDHYPLPRVEDQLDQLAGNKLFTSLDLASGYYQIQVSEESRHKTAFVTPDGQYEYNRMPFGLVNAPSVFQRTINKILHDAKIKYAIVYMDDILIPSKDVSEGLCRLEEVLTLLKSGGLTLKLSKCHFFLDTIEYLGFEISASGIRPGSRKTEAISKFLTPRNVHELRQFLGLSGFFRRFIKNHAVITSPLTDLLKKDASWTWGNDQEESFNVIKSMLVQRPLLALYDPKAVTQLHTDACKDGLAGILLQSDNEGIFHPVSYFSRKTTTDERKLHSYELETLAVIASLSRFRVYLLGIPFTIYTDCSALRCTFVKRDLIPRVARWWVQIQEFDCTIEYRPGSRMAHVDALSRGPVMPAVSESHVLDILSIETSDQNWIATVQDADEEVQRIKSILEDKTTDMVLDIHKNYKLKNGRVYRIVENESRWLVPRGVRWQILKRNHDDIGHFGFDKTLHRIQQHYWFPKMRRFVKKYVQSCLECAHHKIPGGKREGVLHPIEKVCVPFHTVHADHLGPFNKSKKGNCYLLVLIDSFTKYINITAVKNTMSLTSIRVMKEHISYFGVPTRLITDKGTSFTSKTFKEFTSLYGIKHIINAVATPRANGQVERFNRTILDALSTCTHNDDDKSWDDHIYDIQVGLNTTVHKTTKKSPSELLFGFNITSRSEGILSNIISDTTNITHSEDLINIRESASENMKSQQFKDIQRFNSRRKSVKSYKTGDLVRVERQVPHDGKSQKLVIKFQGPYRVMKALPNDRYVIEDTPMTRKNGRRYEAVIAIDKMQPWLTFTRNLGSSDEEMGFDSEKEIDETSIKDV